MEPTPAHLCPFFHNTSLPVLFLSSPYCRNVILYKHINNGRYREAMLGKSESLDDRSQCGCDSSVTNHANLAAVHVKLNSQTDSHQIRTEAWRRSWQTFKHLKLWVKCRKGYKIAYKKECLMQPISHKCLFYDTNTNDYVNVLLNKQQVHLWEPPAPCRSAEAEMYVELWEEVSTWSDTRAHFKIQSDSSCHYNKYTYPGFCQWLQSERDPQCRKALNASRTEFVMLRYTPTPSTTFLKYSDINAHLPLPGIIKSVYETVYIFVFLSDHPSATPFLMARGVTRLKSLSVSLISFSCSGLICQFIIVFNSFNRC